jgi:hypothetical protein
MNMSLNHFFLINNSFVAIFLRYFLYAIFSTLFFHAIFRRYFSTLFLTDENTHKNSPGERQFINRTINELSFPRGVFVFFWNLFFVAIFRRYFSSLFFVAIFRRYFSSLFFVAIFRRYF